MRALVARIHVLLDELLKERRGWHPNSGLPELGIDAWRKSGSPQGNRM